NIEDDPSAAPTVRLVNSILERAITERASDLHFEPQEAEMVVRLRIDGSLHALYHIPVSAMNAVVSRLKVMGNMDIAERKIPQDGRANIRIKERNVDLRISTLPTVYGEKLVIRLLDKSVANLGHQGIGLKGTSLERYELLLRNSSGVILISGPTGSGKSSTMYTMIQDLNTEGVNLVTLEDPVEFNTKGVNQCQINEKTGMTFANGLRSILRQDPDIIVVGEIRDGETASIAMRAAITGHLVLSTIHTNDTIATVDRLLDMGVEPFLISTALKGVMAQRLVKRICPRCKEAYHPSHEDCELSGIPYTPELLFYKGRGCPECFNTGYRGRAAVFEILVIDNVVRKLISTRADRDAILAHLNGTSFLSLAAFSRQMVLEGITTVQEASRTIYSTASEE
ncbi:MAG: GspE/PulE family protein, partial [Oscillospiraceae bacterium]